MIYSEVKTNFSLFKTRIYLAFCFIIFALGFIYLSFNLLAGGGALAASMPSRSEIYIQTSFLNSSVDLHFTPTEANSSAKKINSTRYTVKTNNPTGYLNYISSIDEDTALKHHDPTVSIKIMPTNSNTLFNALTENTWGYCKNVGGNSFCYPVSSLSHPTTYDDAVLSHSSNGFNIIDTYEINFGARVSSSLLPGTYSKTILMTTVAKEFTLESEFLPGTEFNSIVTNLDPTHNVSTFKHSVTPPQDLSRAKIVSTSGSDRPIYAWYDSSDRTVYWWSDADVTYVNGNAAGMFADFNHSVSDMDLIDIRGMNTSRVVNMNRFFYDGSTIVKNYNIDDIDTSKVTDFTEMFASARSGNTPTKSPLDFSKINTVNAITLSGMFRGSSFSSIDVSHFDTKNVRDLRDMFNLAELGTSHIDLRNWDVSRVDSTSGMFRDARIGRVDIGGWNSHSLHDTSNMFRNANISSGLNMVGFDTSNVVDMSGMFSFSNIPNLDLAYLDTSNAKSMRSMFEGGRYYSSLDLARFDTRKVEDFSSMFRGINIDSRTLDVSSFDTSNATSFRFMFDGTNLTGNLDLSNFNTSKVIDMSNMFSSSASLVNVNLSSFDTRSVIDMHGMFYRARMQVIDIRNFNTANVRNMQDMFRESGAVTIKASNLFNTDSVTSSERMFMGVTYLVGENGTGYNTTHPDDKTYARRDTVGQPGYFTF